MQNCGLSAVLHTWYHHTLEQPPDKCDVCGQCWRLQMQCIRRPGRCILTIHIFFLLLAPCTCCWQILLPHRSTQIYILRRTQAQMCIDETTDVFSTQINVRTERKKSSSMMMMIHHLLSSQSQLLSVSCQLSSIPVTRMCPFPDVTFMLVWWVLSDLPEWMCPVVCMHPMASHLLPLSLTFSLIKHNTIIFLSSLILVSGDRKVLSN